MTTRFDCGGGAPVTVGLTAVGPCETERPTDTEYDVTITGPPATADQRSLGRVGPEGRGTECWGTEWQGTKWRGTARRHPCDPSDPGNLGGPGLRLTLGQLQQHWLVHVVGAQVWVAGNGGTWCLRVLPLIDRPQLDSPAAGTSGRLTSPMPGQVIACFVEDGATLSAGDPVLAVEAMKMEHTLTAPVDGTVQLKVTVGQQVGGDELLALVQPLDQPLDQPDDQSDERPDEPASP